MANWLLWPRSRSPVVATWPKPTRVYFTGTSSTSRGEQSGFDANKTQTIKKYNKKQHVTHHSSQNLLDPRGPIQTCDIWTVEGCHDTLEATTISVSCAEPILFVWVWYLKCWESLKIHWLNYHHCHCPHWSLIYGHFGRKSMQITTFKHTHVNLNLYRILSNTSGGFFKKT